MTFLKKYIISALMFTSIQLWAQTVKMESIPKAQTINDDPTRQNKEPEISIGTDADNWPEPDENRIYNTIGLQVQPEFPGGINKFFEFIASKLEKPKYDGVPTKLKVYMTFVIGKDGSLSDIKALRDPGYQLAKEAERVVALCPKWKPGIQNGKAVMVRYSLPITIELP